MYLNQLNEGKEIKLFITIAGKQHKFKSVVKKVYKLPTPTNKFCIGIEPLRIDNKLLVLKEYIINIIVYNEADNRDYKFIIEENNFNKDKSQLLLFSKEIGKPINHRHAYRLPCSYTTILQIENLNLNLESYAHDISFEGMSLLFKLEILKYLTIGSVVNLLIEHKDYLIKVKGLIVRITPFSEKIQLVGIKFIEPPRAISALITELQINECRIRKDKDN